MSSIDTIPSLSTLLEAEQHQPWALQPVSHLVRLLAQTARLLVQHAEQWAEETARRMDVTPGEVWLETIFPALWGVLNTIQGLSESRHVASRRMQRRDAALYPGFDAVRILPANRLEARLLPGFTGHVLLDPDALAAAGKRWSTPSNPAESTSTVSAASQTPPRGPLALCLLPFNLASIGLLDIIDLLCRRRFRVVAKISEKVEFSGPYLEKILDPFIREGALQLAYGGGEVGAALVQRMEFEAVHLTGSTATARAVEGMVGHERLTCELGGVTPAVVLPDALSTEERLRHTARQVAFGALANNGQHCVSYQVVIVPRSGLPGFEQVLWLEMRHVATRSQTLGQRQVVDAVGAEKVRTIVSDALDKGAKRWQVGRDDGRAVPVTLISGVTREMRLFREEIFGPVVGTLALEDADFSESAFQLANCNELAGDLGASIFTANPAEPSVRRMAAQLKHGIVTINTYPGVVFSTSLPWGAGPLGLSGHGWVHNYFLLPESALRKVVLSTELGRKGYGPICWEDPWLLNVTGPVSVDFGRNLLRLAVAYFEKQPLQALQSQLGVVIALARREWQSRSQDRASHY
ncbi:MAG: aldehyde dehydrogenase [Acidobacteriota bacterium]